MQYLKHELEGGWSFRPQHENEANAMNFFVGSSEGATTYLTGAGERTTEFEDGQYTTGNPHFSDARVSDAAYLEVSAKTITACVDIVIVRRRKGFLGWLLSDYDVFVAERQQEPHPGQWVAGGRQFPGETFRDAALRKLQEECGIHGANLLSDSNGQPVELSCYDYIWNTSAQGCPVHTRAHAFVAVLSHSQANSLKLNQEYAGGKWMPLEEAAKLPNHPAFTDMMRSAQRALRGLRRPVRVNISFGRSRLR